MNSANMLSPDAHYISENRDQHPMLSSKSPAFSLADLNRHSTMGRQSEANKAQYLSYMAQSLPRVKKGMFQASIHENSVDSSTISSKDNNLGAKDFSNKETLRL